MTWETPNEDFRRDGWRVTRYGDRCFIERFGGLVLMRDIGPVMARQEIDLSAFEALKRREVRVQDLIRDPYIARRDAPAWLVVGAGVLILAAFAFAMVSGIKMFEG